MNLSERTDRHLLPDFYHRAKIQCKHDIVVYVKFECFIFIYMSLILTGWVSQVSAMIIIYQKDRSLLKFKQICVGHFCAEFSLLSEFLDSQV